MTKRIIQIVLAVVIVCLIYVIYKQISTPIIFAKEKAAREARVIDRIKDIRTAERSFKTKYNRFTGDFDTLINFVLTDSLEFERKIVDEDDSVAMAQLKKSGRKNSEKVWVHVIDTIFTPKKLTAEQVRNLRYVPGTNNQTEFELEAGLVTTESKVVIPVVECRIPYKMFLDTVRFRTIRRITSATTEASSSAPWRKVTMKQVTGATNNKPEIKNVSIRLRLDGHSFSEEKLDIPAKEKKTVEIEVLTSKTMLVPREVFDAKAAPALMRINGMEPTERECILISDPQQPVIALMAADKASVEKVRARLKEKIRWTSPLLRTGEFTASCLWIFRYEELAYLKIWERQTLRLAETFIAPTGEDLLFYVRELTQELQLENCEIRLEGNPTKQDGRLLREYFKHVAICE